MNTSAYDRAGKIPGAILAACVLTIALSACSTSGPGSGPQAAADSITKAVYNNDADGASANFDDALKQQITRASVGVLSDQMHKRGDYKGLTLLSSDPAKNEFTYRADFTSGAMNIVVRLDPDGKVAGYRVFPLS